ncbi:metal ABC transporter permease [Candidatus Roizmanbacteria bacterium]|nr:metal ABC transporter permease [Candidatus Roizmanbacteria bacterium]
MLEIFQYDFMVRAFIAGIIVGIIAPLIGIFLVVRRYSLMADTLAHVSLVGIAGGIIMNINPVVGALMSSIAAAIGMEYLRESKKVFSDSILAIFLSGSLATAIMLISLNGGLNVNIFGYLFGSITTVSSGDLFIISLFGFLAIFIVITFYKSFFLISYDEELAKVSGLSVKQLGIVLTVLAAITVSLAMRVVGVLLVGALMVIPVIAAIQFKKGFFKTTLLALVCSLLSVIGGLFISYYLNLPSGGSIVLVALLIFFISLFVNKSV